MAHMSTEIAHRDASHHRPGALLLEERFAAMEEMGREIHSTERAGRAAHVSRLDETQQQITATRTELEALRRTWWIRVGLALRRRLPGAR
jgi:hypothetical protein